MQKHIALISSLALFFLTGCGDKAVDYVKDNSYDWYPQTSIGSAFDAYFDDGEWTVEEQGGKKVVSFRGKVNEALNDKIHNNLPPIFTKNVIDLAFQQRNYSNSDFEKAYWKQNDEILEAWFSTSAFRDYCLATEASKYIRGSEVLDPIQSDFYVDPTASRTIANSFRASVMPVFSAYDKINFDNPHFPKALREMEAKIPAWKKDILEASKKNYSKLT